MERIKKAFVKYLKPSLPPHIVLAIICTNIIMILSYLKFYEKWLIYAFIIYNCLPFVVMFLNWRIEVNLKKKLP